MKRTGTLIVAALMVSALCMACADKPETTTEPVAPAAPVAAEAVVDTVEVSATVAEIDHATREVVLMTEDGEEYYLVVDDAVENLAQVQQGDVVIATYTEALAYEVIPGGQETGLETTVAAAGAELGEMPAGVVGRKTTLVVTITAIDTEAPSVTFTGPAGNSRTIRVMYPEKLEGVNVGDAVVITYAEALAMSVEKAPTD